MYQDFTTTTFMGRPVGPPAADPASEVASLISRYPNLSETELARLINLYRALPILDMALMMSDQSLAPKLDGFVNDHRRRLRAPVKEYAMLLIIGLAGIAVVLWAAL